jgi:predicted amidohydrolase YtcJ
MQVHVGRQGRRRALALGIATTAVATAWGPPADAQGAKAADAVFRNGYVYTVDERDSVERAVAVRNGKIVYVGGNRGVRRYIGPGTKVTNLRGRMMMPGLQDVHIHGVTAPAYERCNLKADPLTVPELQARLKACLENPAYGSGDDWLIVEDLYVQFLRPAGTVPHKSMLDAIDTDRPIVISAAVTGHNIFVNSKALQLAGITRDTPDPPGGVINRDAAGEPSGLLQDTAGDPVWAVVPPDPPASRTPVELARIRMKEFSRHGITSFFVPGSDPREIRTFQKLRKRGGLTARGHFAVFAEREAQTDPDAYVRQLRRIRGEIERPGQLSRSVLSWRPGRQRGPRLVPRPGVHITGAKLLADGIIQHPAQTAALLEPYLENKGTPDAPSWQPRTDANATGELYFDNPAMGRLIAKLERAGFMSHVHAIGDRAVRVTLDAVEAARKANGRLDSRPSMAHAELVDPADMGRFGDLDVTPVMSFQWAKPAPDSTDGVKPFIGDRWDQYEPEGQLRAAGSRIAYGSDCCLDPWNQWFSLEVAVLRGGDWGPDFPQYAGTLNADPGLSVRDAIRAMTVDAAYTTHEDGVTGSIQRGKLADMIVVDRNLLRTPKERIGDTKTLLTMVGGKVVWRAPGFKRGG